METSYEIWVEKRLRALRVWLQAERIKIDEARARGQDTLWLMGLESGICRVQNKMTELEL